MFMLCVRGIPALLSRHLPMGSGEGTATPITVDSRKLSRADVPWLPVMGEFHFSRYPAAEWREELLKIRAGGIDTVATYLFWNQHEEQRGTLRFDGALGVRRFIELCAELGLYAVVRVGPWVHGECRNGGFPDWVQKTDCAPRTDDPAYLALVEPYFARIAHELRGLSYDAGGPVVAVQIENELYDQPGHLSTLRSLAERTGIRAPLWTATGWGAADIPADVVLPLYGGYPDAFWEDAHDGWARDMRRHYFFTPIRDDHMIGADLRSCVPAGAGPDDRRYPYATCELGGGMAIAYHRRPLIPAADVSALALSKLGSGSVWQGYYMYHGCSQRLGQALPNQGSHDTGYPNDLPAVTYDFQAPLGEYGQVRPSFHALRLQHLLIRDSGTAIADMPLYLPHKRPGGLDDRDTLRWSVRSDGHTGFLFVNNHQPHETLPDHHGVRFHIESEGRTWTLPEAPVTVPAGAHFVWPLGYAIGAGLVLDWATAQPVARLDHDGVPVVVFTSTAGVTPRFALPAGSVVTGPVHAQADDRLTVVTVPEPGNGELVTITGPQGPVHLLVLSEEQALTAQVVPAGGKDRLMLCEEPVLADADELRVHTSRPELDLAVLTPGDSADPGLLISGPGVCAPRTEGAFTRWNLTTAATMNGRDLAVECVRAEAVAPPSRTGGSRHRASAPRDEDFDGAAVYGIDIPDELVDAAAEQLVRQSCTGDVARAYAAGRLVADHFWYGPEWEIGLRRVARNRAGHRLEIRVLPAPRDAEVHVDDSVRAAYEAGRGHARVDRAELLTVHRITLTTTATHG
jgi:beta-galactosidase